MGRFVLFVVFICLLGGRFTLDRLSSSLPAVDLRFAGLGVALIVFLLWQANGHDRPVLARIGPTAVMFAAWLWYMALSAMWAPEAADVTGNLIDLALMGAFVALGWATAARLPREAVASLWTWFWVAGVIYALAAFAAGPGVQGRYSAFGGGPNVFVRVMVLATIGALFYAATRNRNRVLWLVPIFAAGALLSGSRGGLLAFIAVLVIAGIPILRSMARRTRRWLVGIGIAAAVVLPVLFGAETVAFLEQRFVVQTFEQGYSSGRDRIITETIALFNAYPAFGAGLDGYFGTIGHRSGFEYPHNIILAVLAEGGLIGLLLLAGVALVSVHALWTARPLSALAMYFTLAAGYVAVASMFSGDYYDSRLLWFFLGLAVLEAQRESPQSAVVDRLPSSATLSRNRVPLGERRMTPRAAS